MLFTWLISQLGSSGRLPPGWGGVQKAVHISLGGSTRTFHPRTKHLPVAGLVTLCSDEMTIPSRWSTIIWEGPLCIAVGLFPAIVLVPSKSEKLSRGFPFKALMAQTLLSPAATHSAGVG